MALAAPYCRKLPALSTHRSRQFAPGWSAHGRALGDLRLVAHALVDDVAGCLAVGELHSQGRRSANSSSGWPSSYMIVWGDLTRHFYLYHPPFRASARAVSTLGVVGATKVAIPLHYVWAQFALWLERGAINKSSVTST